MKANTDCHSNYGCFEEQTLTISRQLPGNIERVWQYITDSDLRKQWLAEGDMNLEPGATFDLTWRNDELSASSSERPAGFPESHTATCCITEVDPPHLLSYKWPNTGDVTFRLESNEHGVLLTITHRRLEKPETTYKVAAGWHSHLDILTALVSNTPAPSLWSTWSRLHEEYQSIISLHK